MERMLKVAGCVAAVIMLTMVIPVAADAVTERDGSLEFSYSSPPDPVGPVILNHISEQKPAISYQVPEGVGGSFTTP